MDLTFIFTKRSNFWYNLSNMKRGLILSILILVLPMFFALPAKAAGEAAFSVSSQRSAYAAGESVQVSFSVDAGDYDTTLSVIDMTIKVSDSSVLSPSDLMTPFVSGQIYTQVNLQEVVNDTIHVVVNIDPNNKPATRSGVIGTIDFTALKEGTVTVSYDDIKATEEGKETEYISTTASSLDLIISAAGAQVTATATPRVTTSTTAVSTGPEQVILIALLGGFAIFLIYRLIFKTRKT